MNEHVIERYRSWVDLMIRLSWEYRNNPSDYSRNVSLTSRYFLAECCDSGLAAVIGLIAIESGDWEPELSVFTG